MTAPTKTRTRGGPELPLEAPASQSSAVVKSGEPPMQSIAEQPRSNGDAGGQIVSINQLLQLALEKGTPVEQLKEIVALHREVTAHEAALEFARAMAAFQRECPAIKKTSTAQIATRGGGTYSYAYAELDEIARVIGPILERHGLSFSWDSTVEGAALTCVCTIRHVNGHSVTSSFTLPTESPSAMSPQQKVAAALTFAKRQSLTSALGLVTTDDDTDGNSIDPTPINEDQLTELEDLLKETKADRARFLSYLQIDSLEELPSARYKQAVSALEQKKQRGAR